MFDWVESITSLFTSEIDCYKRLLEIEGKKRQAIHTADGKSLESHVKESYHIMVEASELERIRMKSIEEIYAKENFKRDEETLTLTHFLNQMDRDSNYKLKGFAQELKTTVQNLKEAIMVMKNFYEPKKIFFKRQSILSKNMREKKFIHQITNRSGEGRATRARSF
ncbi:MAG: flagellar export chaperone FlgN [Leptospira sp.]|nr:flagellar export chaperone FlgN [Leptospira sp.]